MLDTTVIELEVVQPATDALGLVPGLTLPQHFDVLAYAGPWAAPF
jgi:hypothetical protein